MKTFRAYNLAVQFYKACLGLKMPSHIRLQLHRAAMSIPLNLREGYGRKTIADQQRFFTISFGSIREVQAIFDLLDPAPSQDLLNMIDHLAAIVYKLSRWQP